MGPLYEQVDGDGGLQSNEIKSGLRKYALLVQDSLAIKFVPLNNLELDATENMRSTSQNYNNNNEVSSEKIPSERSQSVNKRDQINGNNGLLRSSRQSQIDHVYASSSAASKDVDLSLHALYLYKGFREANLECYWNGGLNETIRNIEYKGYIVPSIVLVTALPRYLTILRTAWSRRMLRSPQGYQIKFLGDIEELIVEPIGQGQFAPLSDSLCWAILELISLGKEAFVDSIMLVLKGNFPTMSCPSRELVFQTLEKLIRERKIYQTPNGYFIVTPDTFRFMTSGAAPQVSNSFNPIFNLDALIPFEESTDKNLPPLPQSSWNSQKSPQSSNAALNANPLVNDSRNKLKRHNSLKTFRQRDICETSEKDSFAVMRLSRSLSCDQIDQDKDKEEDTTNDIKMGRRSTLNHISTLMRNFKINMINSASSSNKKSTKDNKDKAILDRNTQGKSLFRRIFGRSRSKSREPMKESIQNSSTLLPVGSNYESSPISAHSYPVEPLRPSTTDSALYDSLNDHDPRISNQKSSPGDKNNSPNSPQFTFPGSTHFPSFHRRDEPSRCSTLSHATSSLGYGSEGYPPSLNLSSPSSGHSPYPNEITNQRERPSRIESTNINSNLDFYRRRYPSYSNSFSKNSPHYASLNPPPPGTSRMLNTNNNNNANESSSPHSLYNSLLTTAESQSQSPNPPIENQNQIKKIKSNSISEAKVTQTLKSTTDMELELILPLGNIMKAAINAKKQTLKDNFFREEYNREPPNSNPNPISNDNDKIPLNLDKASGIKLNVAEPKTKTEVRTIINKNGRIEEHWESLPNPELVNNVRSNVEINLNGKNVSFGWDNQLNSNHKSKVGVTSTSSIFKSSRQCNKDYNNGNGSKWCRTGGVTVCGNVGKEFDENIQVSII